MRNGLAAKIMHANDQRFSIQFPWNAESQAKRRSGAPHAGRERQVARQRDTIRRRATSVRK